ncbi:hypothetical protein EIP86_005568 [Pleurotus ostreatoroseus]|nr:hypothetical protein EIP86_005568 [Pleurotus ostreatoroseus]
MSLQYPLCQVDFPEDPNHDSGKDKDDLRGRLRVQSASHTLPTSASLLTQHSRASVHVYIQEDLKEAQRVGFDIFIETIFGLAADKLAQWTSIIAQEKWHTDDEVARNLKVFCETKQETRRHVPLSNIINRIMQMAPGRLPGVPDKYPIDDICVRRNNPLHIQTIDTYGALGAKRRPALLTLRGKTAVNLEAVGASQEKPRQQGVRWVDDLMNWEQKGAVDLQPVLDGMIRDRADTDQESQSSVSSNEYRSSRAYDSEDDILQAGMKRIRGDDDLMPYIRCPDPSSRYTGLNSEEALIYDLKDAAIQTGSYALETLACTYGSRLFCINVLLENDRVYLWYYDACGFVYTESISLIEDFEKAAAVIVGIACSTPAQLGALPSVISPPPSLPYPDNWPPESLKEHTVVIPNSVVATRSNTAQNLQITLKDPVFTQYILSGRRTFVYTTETQPAVQKGELIVKFSYQVSTRRKEYELVNIARKAGVTHLPTIHAWGDLWNMSDGIRQIFYDKAGAEYEDRTLRAVIYDRYLPLETLFPNSPGSIPIMAYQIMDCIHDLRYNANILHRDISLNNVMYEYRDGRLHFVLIDFDMATVILDGTPYVPSSKHRTGTLAFMAVELIEDAAKVNNPDHKAIAHLLCHDYESIYWLCLWCALVLVATADELLKARNLAIVRAWETKELWLIARSKTTIRFRPLYKNEIVLPEAAVDAGLHEWFAEWQQIWFQYEQVLTPYWAAVDRYQRGRGALPELDMETAGGVLTLENLKAILTKNFPDPYASARTEESASHGPTVGTRALGRNETAYASALMDDRAGRKAAPKKSRTTKKSKKATATKAKAKAPPAAKKAKTSDTAKKAKAPEPVKKVAAPTKRVTRRAKAEQKEAEVDDTNDIRKRLRPRKR